MKRSSYLGVALTMLALLVPAAVPMHAVAATKAFSAHLTGAQVVPATESRATGQAWFQLSADGTQLEFRVNVANIENVTQASLHLGTAGQNGEVVAVLYGPQPAGGGRKDGLLAKGTITQASLVGSLSGRPLDDLVAAMKAGTVYIDVTTNAGSPDQRPGNLMNGEIRGQVR